MKTTYKLLLAVLASVVALASCTRDSAEQSGPKSRTDGIRTIAVSFETPTKSKLIDGLTPQFEEGDQIMVSNGKKFEVCEVMKYSHEQDGGKYDSIHDGTFYFETELEGHLSAVYPADCAKMKGAEITGILVPNRQSGRFKDANIAVASIDEDEGRLYYESRPAIFVNKTAVLRFYVGETIGVMNIRISNGELDDEEALPIANAYYEDETLVEDTRGEIRSIMVGSREKIPTEPQEYRDIAAVDSVSIEELIVPQPLLSELTDDPSRQCCYVAILPTPKRQTYNLTVESTTTSYQGTAGKKLVETKSNVQLNKMELAEQNTYLVRRKFSDVELSAGTLASVFMPYMVSVGVGTDENDETIYQRWGYCNVGAFLPVEEGKYFAWGETIGHESNYNFTWATCPFNNRRTTYDSDYFNTQLAETGESAIYRTTEIYPDGMLTPDNDAATSGWGDCWRLPTKYEVETLANCNPSITSVLNDSGYPVGFSIAQLTFPFSQIIAKDIPSYDGKAYWTSTLDRTDKKNAYVMYFEPMALYSGPQPNASAVEKPVKVQPFVRYAGLPIRPIYGTPAVDAPGLGIDSFEEDTILY